MGRSEVPGAKGCKVNGMNTVWKLKKQQPLAPQCQTGEVSVSQKTTTSNIATINSSYNYAKSHPIKYTDPDGRAVEDDLQWLKDYVHEGNKQQPSEKASWARGLRNLIRDFDLDALFQADQDGFMDGDLRDFLNTSNTGEDYNESDINSSELWSLHPGNKYHKDSNHQNVRKYVNKDGREVVFGTNDSGGREEIKSPQYKGTYNYAKNVYQWWDSSEHGRWDMIPYFKKFKLEGY
ncbi:hypothetical protein FACS1894130_00200 [Spirochaetia bacterium]|nr:hypothetical protein FACS1894130_00200 [Spirochaetia bacterium]